MRLCKKLVYTFSPITSYLGFDSIRKSRSAQSSRTTWKDEECTYGQQQRMALRGGCSPLQCSHAKAPGLNLPRAMADNASPARSTRTPCGSGRHKRQNAAQGGCDNGGKKTECSHNRLLTNGCVASGREHPRLARSARGGAQTAGKRGPYATPRQPRKKDGTQEEDDQPFASQRTLV